MKLILCRNCGDVFKLDYKVRACKCGACKGQYLPDGLHAEYTDGIPLGFANDSLMESLQRQPRVGWGEPFQAFVIPRHCDTMVLVHDLQVITPEVSNE